MSVDLQVMLPQEIVELSSVRTVPGLRPRTLDIAARDVRDVDEVLVNGIAAEEVVVVSPSRLLAQVPPSLANDTITSVTVVSQRLGASARSVLRFRLGRTPSKVSGLLRLVQVFLKLLLTTPGRDIFAPTLGGAALRNIGLTFGRDEGGAIVSDLVVAVARTQRQLLGLQARDPRLPRDERLLSAKVASAGFNRNEAALVVAVELTSQAGRSAVARVEI